LERASYPFLVIGAALTGAAIAVVLSVFGIAGPPLDGAIGFGVYLWLVSWGNLRRKMNVRQAPA